MKVQIEKVGPTLLISVNGEIDLNTAPIFRQSVEEKLAQYEGIKNILVDLSGTPFMDSSGLGVLLYRFKQISQAGGKMVLVGVKPQIFKVLELSGAHCIMGIFNDRDEGMRALEGGQH